MRNKTALPPFRNVCRTGEGSQCLFEGTDKRVRITLKLSHATFTFFFLLCSCKTYLKESPVLLYDRQTNTHKTRCYIPHLRNIISREYPLIFNIWLVFHWWYRHCKEDCYSYFTIFSLIFFSHRISTYPSLLCFKLTYFHFHNFHTFANIPFPFACRYLNSNHWRVSLLSLPCLLILIVSLSTFLVCWVCFLPCTDEPDNLRCLFPSKHHTGKGGGRRRRRSSDSHRNDHSIRFDMFSCARSSEQVIPLKFKVKVLTAFLEEVKMSRALHLARP